MRKSKLIQIKSQLRDKATIGKKSKLWEVVIARKSLVQDLSNCEFKSCISEKITIDTNKVTIDTNKVTIVR